LFVDDISHAADVVGIHSYIQNTAFAGEDRKQCTLIIHHRKGSV